MNLLFSGLTFAGTVISSYFMIKYDGVDNAKSIQHLVYVIFNFCFMVHFLKNYIKN